MLSEQGGAEPVGHRKVASKTLVAAVVVTAAVALLESSPAPASSAEALSAAPASIAVTPVPTFSDPAGVATSFGSSVAISGHEALVGSADTTIGGTCCVGEAVLFQKTGGHWGDPTVFAAPARAGANFGSSVAVSGTTAIVGAPHANGGKGAAYLYEEAGSSWPTQPTAVLHDPGRQVNDGFAWTVAFDGTTLVVGAPYAPGGTGAGVVYVYGEGPSGLRTTPKAVLADPESSTAGDDFGTSVSVSGPTVMVGDIDAESPHQAYIYAKGPSGWPRSPTTILPDPSNASHSAFGEEVAVSGSTALVGSAAENAAYLPGHVYVYTLGSSGWPQNPDAKLTNPGPHQGNNGFYGSAIAISGDVAVVGAWATQSSTGAARTGAAYLYDGPIATWSEEVNTIADPGEQKGASMGYAASVSGTAVLVSAPQQSIGSPPLAGIGYLVDG
jgi:hypothetical protein